MQLVPVCLILFLLQGLAAVPWMMALSRKTFREQWPFLWKVVAGVTLGGLLFGLLLRSNSDPGIVTLWGRLYGSVLAMQVGIDVFIGIIWLLLKFLPKTGAVTLAAFQESIRQPMFWLL